MAYVPDATVGGEPVDTRKASTAALEFRTLKTYIQATLIPSIAAKLPTASYTAADVLAKLLTVDGAGSGIDADLLDGVSSAGYLTTAGGGTSLGPIAVTRGGAGNDPYGAISITRPTDANSYAYFGMTRAGQVGIGVGINTSNQFWLGNTGGGVDGVLAGNPWLLVAANGTYAQIGGKDVLTGSAGLYGAVATALQNIDSITMPVDFHYTYTLGNGGTGIVRVSGLITSVEATTANLLTRFRLSLPVPSNLGAPHHLSGSIVRSSIGSGIPQVCGIVYGDDVNNAAEVAFTIDGNTGGYTYAVDFTYRVL